MEVDPGAVFIEGDMSNEEMEDIIRVNGLRNFSVASSIRKATEIGRSCIILKDGPHSAEMQREVLMRKPERNCYRALISDEGRVGPIIEYMDTGDYIMANFIFSSEDYYIDPDWILDDRYILTIWVLGSPPPGMLRGYSNVIIRDMAIDPLMGEPNIIDPNIPIKFRLELAKIYLLLNIFNLSRIKTVLVGTGASPVIPDSLVASKGIIGFGNKNPNVTFEVLFRAKERMEAAIGSGLAEEVGADGLLKLGMDTPLSDMKAKGLL